MTGGLHVVFGTGSLGMALMEALRADGERVRMASRSGRATVPDGVELTRADATDVESAKAACEGASVVYLCAAPPYTDWAGNYLAMQTGVLEAAGAADAVAVLAESIYAYGKVEGPITEDTPFSPCSKKGAIRVELHEAWKAAHDAGRVRVVSGYAPDYFGPGAVTTTVYGERVFYPALEGKPAEIFGDVEAKHSWIYVDDFARGLVILGTEERAWGERWHLPCPPPLTQRAMLEKIYAATGHEMKVRAMPTWLTPILGWFIPVMRELAEMQYQWTDDLLFDACRFTEAFGADHVVPHDEAIARTVEWFRAHPKK